MWMLLRKYDEYIEVVDPQLKNNPELVEVIEAFEKSWTLGHQYLVNEPKYQMLLNFSWLIESL